MRDQDFFWEGAKSGKLLFQKCSDCGALRNPPGPMCSHCQSLKWEPFEARGVGTVAAWVLSKHPTQPDNHSRLVALITLAEGLRMVSNLEEVSLDQVRLDMPVEVFFAEVEGTVMPLFRPSSPSASAIGEH
jgi:uncharacterized OB-fold protein